MFGAQATLLLALAAATAVVLWRRPASSGAASGPAGSAPQPELGALRSFLVVGSGALVVLALLVVGVGLFDRPDRAAGLAVVSLFGYLVYLGLAVGCCRWAGRPTPRADPGADVAPR